MEVSSSLSTDLNRLHLYSNILRTKLMQSISPSSLPLGGVQLSEEVLEK